MRIWFNNFNIYLDRWDNEIELKKYLDKCESGKYLFGYNTERNEIFYSVTIYNENDCHKRTGIGFIIQYQGIIPQLLFLNEIDEMLIGFGETIIGYDVKNKSIIFEYTVDGSIFWEFLLGNNKNIIIIICEYSIIGINSKGNELWEYSHDVLQQYTIIDDYLYVEFMDKTKIKININTGEVENQS